MAKDTKRDNDYYAPQLKENDRSIYDDWAAGKIPTLATALLQAGIKQKRTRLHELKNAWKKGTATEQAEFLKWLADEQGLTCVPTISATSTRSISTRTVLPSPVPLKKSARLCHLPPEMKESLIEIIEDQKIATGEILRQIGFKPLDPSLGIALRKNSRVSVDMIEQLKLWLPLNKSAK